MAARFQPCARCGPCGDDLYIFYLHSRAIRTSAHQTWPVEMHVQSLAAHLVYGIVAERVRRVPGGFLNEEDMVGVPT